MKKPGIENKIIEKLQKRKQIKIQKIKTKIF